MTEPRRIETTSASIVVVGSAKTKTVPTTVRLSVPLTESTDDTYPEFSYVELLYRNSGTLQGSTLDPKDPFAAQDQTENDRLVAIARSFDSKYGLQPGKRNHASMLEDFIDLGEGCEEDSFVDNSEAYDELVPSTMKTKYGGFYINSGELDFVPVEDNSADGQILKKKIKKRKVIESDVEEVICLDKKKKVRKKRENGCDEALKKKQKKTNADDGKTSKGPPGHALKSDACKMVADVLNEAGLTVNIKAPDTVPCIPVSPVHKNLSPGIDKLVVSSQTHVIQSLSVSTDRQDDKDANVEPRVEPTATKSEPNISAIESSIDAVILQSREEAASENLKEAGSETTQSSLPKSIPAELLKTVERMKELALAGKVTSDESSAGHRLTNEVQHPLSEIHEFLSKLEQSDRLAVFDYLGCYFPNGKDGLIKHMKRLDDLTLHCDQLKLPIAKLKEAIQAVMPSLIEKHRVEVTAKEKQRLDQLQEQKERREPKDGAAQSDSDDDDENRDAAEKQRRIVAPRKKFEWNYDIRQLLCRVVDIKMKHFETGKIRSQAPEDYLKSFLEAEIKPLWPPGWIQTRMLFKESRSSHNRWTCNIPKMKKSALAFSKTSAPFVVTPLEIHGHGLGNHHHHHQGANISFNVPAFVPGTKMQLLLEEALSGNRSKLQESHVAYSASGTSTANGVMEDPVGEVLFTSINSKAASKHERETNANNGLDLKGENGISLQKLRKGLLPKLPAVVQETENTTKHSARSKQSNVDKCNAVVEATDVKVISVLSSSDSDTAVVSKAENEPQATFPVNADIVCRLSTNSVQKSNVSAGVGNSFAAQGYHDEGMGVPSKRLSQAGCSEGSPVDSARSSLHGQCQLFKADNAHDLVSHQLPNTSHVEQFVRLASAGKCSSNAASVVGLGLAAQDSAARFTEICSLQRQSSSSSSNANSQVYQKPGVSSLSPVTNSGCAELQTALASPASRRMPNVSPQRLQQESSSVSTLAQSPSGPVLPKAPGQGIYKMASPARQKAAVTSLGNNFPKWNSKATSTSAWTVTMATDDTPKFATPPVGKTASCSRTASGNVVATVSSSGHKPRLSTFRAAASTDQSAVARVTSSSSSTVSEEAVADAFWLSQARQNSQNEDSSKATMFEELLQRIPLESWPIVLESCLNSQELNRAMTAEARLFDTGGSSKLTKHITHDHLYPVHGKAMAAKTTAQSWRPSNEVQTVSAIRGASPCNAGFIIGQQCNKNLGDRTPEYSQQQFIKTSIPSSSHDSIQIPDAVTFPSHTCNRI